MNNHSRVEEVVTETEIQNGGCDGPYIVYSVHRTILTRQWNPAYDQDTSCQCGHSYARHFDPYDNMYPIGCKYCNGLSTESYCASFSPSSELIHFRV